MYDEWICPPPLRSSLFSAPAYLFFNYHRMICLCFPSHMRKYVRDLSQRSTELECECECESLLCVWLQSCLCCEEVLASCRLSARQRLARLGCTLRRPASAAHYVDDASAAGRPLRNAAGMRLVRSQGNLHGSRRLLAREIYLHRLRYLHLAAARPVEKASPRQGEQ
ncbi:MAG: hypothetical protein JWM95_3893 [Gemmatimonadetes bacterium]|nr:hypothetical protein [Gemmatimonadota bacterium]